MSLCCLFCMNPYFLYLAIDGKVNWFCLLHLNRKYTVPPPKHLHSSWTHLFCLNPTNPFYFRCNNHPSLVTWRGRRITIPSFLHSSCHLFHPFQFSPFVTGDRSTNRPFTTRVMSQISLFQLTLPACRSSSKSEIKPLVARRSCILCEWGSEGCGFAVWLCVWCGADFGKCWSNHRL